MVEYEFQRIVLPRGTTRHAAHRLLTDRAEYDHWELVRLRLLADGSRHVLLRRKIIRQRRRGAAPGGLRVGPDTGRAAG